MAAKNLGELLIREKMIDIVQLENAKKEQKVSGGRLGSALVKLGFMNDSQLTEFLSQQYQIPAINLSDFEVDPEAIKAISREICEKHGCLPVAKTGNTIVVAMADPSNIFAKDDIAFLTRCKIETVVASEHDILQSLDKYYGQKTNFESVMTEMEQVAGASASAEAIEIADLDASQADAPIIRFVNLMLNEAIKMRVSDIHIENYEKRFRIRFRIDGVLYEKITPPQGISGNLLSRIKVMSKLDIAERRRPQDGRLRIVTKGKGEIDFRVSALPTVNGEKIVMRLLDKSNLQLDMTQLGFEDDELALFKEAILAPYGMILMTGPTGSGKTTTIYSALSALNKSDINISTAEDPVEFRIDGINQVQMNPEIDVNFSSTLRSFLRQDPDVIMVGEIRDYETADIAFKAAMTGHLVVSTLHTNDAPSTVNRFLNMGFEPFIVTSAVNLIVAQRLVRKVCTKCKVPQKVDTQVLINLGVPEADIGTFEPMKGQGCSQCNGLGYRGRVAVYELMKFNDEVKSAIFQNVTPIELKRLAAQAGMRTLRMNVIKKMKQGLTTIEEVAENTMKD